MTKKNTVYSHVCLLITTSNVVKSIPLDDERIEFGMLEALDFKAWPLNGFGAGHLHRTQEGNKTPPIALIPKHKRSLRKLKYLLYCGCG